MSEILLVTSSPRGTASHSSRIAGELARGLQAASPGSRLAVRDLAAQPLPHIGSDFAAGIHAPADTRSAAQAQAVASSDAAVAELLAADTVVIAAGLINFAVPSTLKAWLDHVARAGQTFRYSEKGPEGLVTGRKVYLVIASGGVYSDGPAAAFDHAVPYLRTMLGFLGMTDVELIRVEGVAMGPDAEARALSQARAQLSGLAQAA
ncbi:MAG: FMN-dependent NADH-azoreductase [Sneathiellaceae bacterium]